MGLGELLMSVFLSPACVRCSSRPGPTPFLCAVCEHALCPPDSSVLAALCPRFEPGLRRLWSAWYMEPGGTARATVHAIKYQFSPALACWAGGIAAEGVPPEEQFDAIVPVPLHRMRRLERGFNQSEQIARGASAVSGTPVSTALARTSSRVSQTRLSAADRRELGKETFLVQIPVRGQRLLLVDDVITTGSTLNSAAGVLLAAGALDVCGLTLAVSRRPGSP
jgi:ComF family protein